MNTVWLFQAGTAAERFRLAAAVSPLVGLSGEGSALPMATVMLVAGVIALLSLVALTRGVSDVPDAEPAERHGEPLSQH